MKPHFPTLPLPPLPIVSGPLPISTFSQVEKRFLLFSADKSWHTNMRKKVHFYRSYERYEFCYFFCFCVKRFSGGNKNQIKLVVLASMLSKTSLTWSKIFDTMAARKTIVFLAKLYYTSFWDKFGMNIIYFGLYPKSWKTI